ncbi:FecR family protein [Methylomonas sp. HW2-6]|uniref:FecR family protein n=1 Tax=Methylomonas sp. HW2-6 TaxID=3376687 RepID=UPI004040F2DF
MPDRRQQHAEQQAMEWQARLSSDLADAAVHQAFQAWLAQASENRQAWRDVNDFWRGLDQLPLADTDLAPPIAAARPVTRPRKRWSKTGLALAASALLGLTLAYPQWSLLLADYRSAVGEQRQVQLSDGSTVLLNSGSAFSVNFSAERRRIELARGEAYFEVAADKRRPFVVTTEAGEIQALGTAFSVRCRDGGASVTVFEHAVKITTAGGRTHERLSANQQLGFAGDRLEPVAAVNPQRAGAWRQRRMVFQDQKLAEVIAELERYRPGKILIVDRRIADLPLTGVFDIGDTDQALQTIAQTLPVKVTTFGDALVLLSAG